MYVHYNSADMRYTDMYIGRDNILHEIILPKSIITWILNHVDCPINGYEHKTSPYGGYMSPREQLSETHYQLFVIASDYFRRGAKEDKIITALSSFLKNSAD